MVANGCMGREASVEEEVDRLKMEIREVKALIWEGRIKLAATADAEERHLLREEQKWLFDEARSMRDEVRLRLEARNLMLQQQLAARCADGCAPPSVATAASWKMPMVQRPETPGWVFPPDFVAGWPPPPLPTPQEMHKQQQQQQQQHPRKELEQHVDLSSWTTCLQQQQQQAQSQQQPQQSQQQKSRLPPLRPRKDPSATQEARSDPVVMQPPKSSGSSSKRRRNMNSASSVSSVKEEQENFVLGGREERGKRPRWKDHWVMQLIHVRGGMQEEFGKPPKQGVDLWRQVYTKLVSACPDFDKEPEACRKKWKMLVTDYKASVASNNNTVANNSSSVTNSDGSERPDKCRWYHLMDDYISIKDMQTSVGVAANAAATVANIACLEEVTSELDC